MDTARADLLVHHGRRDSGTLADGAGTSRVARRERLSGGAAKSAGAAVDGRIGDARNAGVAAAESSGRGTVTGAAARGAGGADERIRGQPRNPGSVPLAGGGFGDAGVDGQQFIDARHAKQANDAGI